MQIKRFEAKTMTAALKMVKDEFGPDAVILSARTLRRNRGLFGAVRAADVELTAAIDFQWPAHPTAGRRGAYPEAPATAPEAPAPAVRRGLLHTLNEGLRSFAGRRGRPVAADGVGGQPAELAELHRHWLSQEVPQDIAAQFTEHLKRLPGYGPMVDLDRLRPQAATLLHDMGLRRFAEAEGPRGRRMLTLVGPSGAGKTVMAVKLAALESLQGRRVALLSLDDRRIGAIEQMRIYAGIVGVPWGVAGTSSEAQQLAGEWADMERIIIDTPGVSPGEAHHRADIQDILAAVKCQEVHLVLNAGLREKDLMSVIDAWKKTPVRSLAFTRLDETHVCGSLLNVAIRNRLPISWLSTGPRIPEDLTDRPLELLVDRLWPQSQEPDVRPRPGVQSAGPPIGVNPPAASAAPLVANRNSDLYHRIDCKWARRIKSDHLLQFVSVAEAESRNFHACRSCCPEATASEAGEASWREAARRSGCR
jgi:flagellar biosynthesis protein FlhF